MRRPSFSLWCGSQRSRLSPMNGSKRVFDVCIAGAGLVALAPFWIMIAAAIRLDSPGPILHRGVRMGRDGKPFAIYKFRTMVVDAAARGAGITTRHDPRITRVGRFLRKTKLDELPQLLNVLHGEMSFVGPRPEDPRYLRYYTAEQRALLNVSPGITGVASLVFRNEQEMLNGADWERTYIAQVLPQKLNLELEYLKRRSFWSDLHIIARTVLPVPERGRS